MQKNTGGMMKAVFIDIDNTLLDFDEYVRNTMETGFRHFSLKPYEPYMYDVFIRENGRLWRRIEQGELTFKELEKVRWNIIFGELGIEFDGPVFEKYFRAALNDSAIPVAGSYEMLEALRERGCLICAASNGPYEQQLRRLEIADMLRYFDHVFISEKIGASKPSGDFFEHAFSVINSSREESILPHETVMIGDSLTSDIAGGRQYGMQTCWYMRDREQEIPADVGIAVDDLRDVAGRIF